MLFVLIEKIDSRGAQLFFPVRLSLPHASLRLTFEIEAKRKWQYGVGAAWGSQGTALRSPF